MALQSNLKIAV